MGRPSKYNPDRCAEVIASSAEGHSLTGYAGSIGVTQQTITNWAKQYPEFADAVAEAKAACLLCWEKKLIAAANDKKDSGNIAAIIFALKNRGPDDWRERVDHEVGGRKDSPLEVVDVTEMEVARRVALLLTMPAEGAKPSLQ